MNNLFNGLHSGLITAFKDRATAAFNAGTRARVAVDKWFQRS